MNTITLPDHWAIPFDNVIAKYSISRDEPATRDTPAFGGEIEDLYVYALINSKWENVSSHPDVKAYDNKIKQYIYENQ